jgi:hypothetical protein
MEGLLAGLREARAKLLRRAECCPGVVAHTDALARLEIQLAQRPRVIVLGEGNAGKTSLVNLLLDQALLPSSVVANTRRPLVLRFAESIVVTGVTPFGRLDLRQADGEPHCGLGLESLEIGLPNPRLATFDLVDTPAMSASAQLELGATDLLLWCTVATQAWKQSERRLWMAIAKRHHRRAILVATHKDSLRGDEAHRIRARLAAETADSFGAIVFVCAAGRRESFGPNRRQYSGAAELDALIASNLSAMAQRRRRAGYRLANYIVGRAVKLVELDRDQQTPQINDVDQSPRASGPYGKVIVGGQ